MTFGIAYGFGLLLGLPMYFALRRFGWANRLTAALWGAVVANLFLCLSTASEWRAYPVAQLLPGMLIFGGLGAMGGGMFYTVVGHASAAEVA